MIRRFVFYVAIALLVCALALGLALLVPTVRENVVDLYLWYTDQEPPAVQIVAPSGVVKGTVSVAIVVTDNYACTTTSITVDSATVAGSGVELLNNELIIDTTKLPDGDHLVQVEAQDLSRRKNVGRATAKFTTDNAPPRLAVELDPPVATQGHALLVKVRSNEPATISAAFDGQAITLNRGPDYLWYLTGFDALAKPGEHLLQLEAADPIGNTSRVTSTIRLAAFPFRTETIWLPPGNLKQAQENARLLQQEKDRRMAAYARVSPERLWEGVFAWPVAADITSDYGTRRSYNGGPVASYHEGLDLGAKPGTPVLAANRGKVALAQEMKGTGNTVIIDHGLGLYTAYLHLQELRVQEGHEVAKGETIGLVGNTGLFSTGAHLHWEVRLGGIPLEPIEWTRRAMPE
ncbi:MAG: M23 family metallopeptidase [Chloroflexota bacterium]